jgi:hypothetical protein
MSGRTILTLAVLLAMTSSLAFGSYTWDLYDDFNTGLIDPARWLRQFEDGGDLPVASGGGVSLTGIDVNGPISSESIMVFLGEQARGIRADLNFLLFDVYHTQGFGSLFIEVDIGGGQKARVGIYPSWINTVMSASINNADGQKIAGQSLENPFYLNETATLSIVVLNSSIEFYKNDLLAWTYIPPMGGSYTFQGAEIQVAAEYCEYQCFVDNVYIYQPCPKADLNNDCFVDLADLAIMAQQWLTGWVENEFGIMVYVD